MKFGVIVADPPWEFSDKLKMSDVKRGAEDQYPIVSYSELSILPIEKITADDAVLALWCPSAVLPRGFKIMADWGFSYKQLWVWAKTRNNDLATVDESDLSFGLGRLARSAKEVVLVGIHGKPYKHLMNRSIRDVFFAKSLRHSQKPEIVQDALDKMFPDLNKIELFARRDRDGWTCVGNECPSTMGEDIRESLGRLSTQ